MSDARGTEVSHGSIYYVTIKIFKCVRRLINETEFFTVADKI
jgi:hypothetical protein